MTGGEKAAAVVVVLGLAGVAGWSLSGGAGIGGTARLELGGSQPGCARHGLYRRFDGHAARQAVAEPGGWEWFASPPASEVL
jgi:hypothetical protein